MEVAAENSLIQDAPSIFAHAGPWNVRSMTRLSNNMNSGCKIKVIPDINVLEDNLQELLDQSSVRIFVIRQQNSWSRLQISYSGFLRLVSYLDASPGFTDFVRAFGFKSSNKDENFGGYHRHVRKQPNHEDTHYDLCFNIRYPEHVRRNGEYPWVLRHTAIYQSCRISASSSNWILIQPSQTVEDKLKILLNKPKHTENATKLDYECKILSMILAATEANWRPYINHLESEINKLDDMACFSRVGKVVSQDYAVAFSDSQELQLSRERLLRALSAIDSSLESLSGIQDHLDDLKEHGFLSNHKQAQIDLDHFKSRMNGHKRALHRLLEVSSGTSHLLLKILDFRNDEVMQRNAANTHAILEATNRENEAMRIISQRTQVDSRSTRILTSITIAYLPANVVAAVFSSNMVQTGGGQNGTSAKGSQIGYFILSTMVLTLATACVALLWERDIFVGANARIRRILRV